MNDICKRLGNFAMTTKLEFNYSINDTGNKVSGKDCFVVN